MGIELYYAVMGCLVLILASILHEFGHAWAYHSLKGVWLPIKVRWWGVELGSTRESRELTVFEASWVRVGGIALGYVPVFIGTLAFLMDTGTTMLTAYAIMCSIDIYALIQLWGLRKHPNAKLKNLKIIDISTSKIFD